MKSYIKQNGKFRITLNKKQLLFAFVLCVFIFIERNALTKLDALHIKHYLLMGMLFLYGIPLLKRKNLRAYKEAKYVVIVCIVLYLISIIMQISHLSFKLYSVGEIYYLIIPLLYGVTVFNNINSDDVDTIMYLTLAVCLFSYFFWTMQMDTFTLSNMIKMFDLRNLFIKSISPVGESDLANYFMLLYLYFTYRKKRVATVLSAVGVFFGYKRFAVLFLIIFIIVLRFVPRYKKVNKVFIYTAIAVFLVLPFVTYFLCSDEFANWFYMKFKVDFNEFTMTRFYLINLLIDSHITNYGLGTTTAFLNRLTGAAKSAGNLHNDIFRIYYETTIVGSLVFTYNYFKMSEKSWFTFMTMLYIFAELFGAHFIGPGTTSFWMVAYLLIFTISIDVDKHKEQLKLQKAELINETKEQGS
ncbi:MAG: hypothetical protein IKF64_08150 [Eubacterium sp.]|nr:hypothetical protein [Eubacterium sp.]